VSSLPNAVSSLKVPDLELPFTCAGHPEAAEIGEATLAWLRDAGLLASEEQIQRTREKGDNRWYPAVVPDGPADRVLLGSMLTCYYVVLDDQVAEQEGSRRARLAAVTAQLLRCEQVTRFPDRTEPAGAIEDVARDLARRLRKVATPDQIVRMRWHALQYFLAITAEAAHTAESVTPDIAGYRRIRQLTSCMAPFFVMGEIVHGFSTPMAAAMEPEAQELTALGSELTALCNDIIGLPRDLARGDSWTYARILVERHGCSYQEAVDLMADEFHRTAEVFVNLADRLRARTLGPYVAVHQDVVAGHLAWTRASPRYTIQGWH
jgi:hypothetical protein